MLIEKSKKDAIVLLKLVSGEEIICTLVSDNEFSYDIKKPLMFVISNKPNETSTNDVVFVPWVIGGDFDMTFNIKESKVIAKMNASKIAEEKYNEALGTKKSGF